MESPKKKGRRKRLPLWTLPLLSLERKNPGPAFPHSDFALHHATVRYTAPTVECWFNFVVRGTYGVPAMPGIGGKRELARPAADFWKLPQPSAVGQRFAGIRSRADVPLAGIVVRSDVPLW